jgi:hypothetical protein
VTDFRGLLEALSRGEVGRIRSRRRCGCRRSRFHSSHAGSRCRLRTERRESAETGPGARAARSLPSGSPPGASVSVGRRYSPERAQPHPGHHAGRSRSARRDCGRRALRGPLAGDDQRTCLRPNLSLSVARATHPGQEGRRPAARPRDDRGTRSHSSPGEAGVNPSAIRSGAFDALAGAPTGR